MNRKYFEKWLSFFIEDTDQKILNQYADAIEEVFKILFSSQFVSEEEIKGNIKEAILILLVWSKFKLSEKELSHVTKCAQVFKNKKIKNISGHKDLKQIFHAISKGKTKLFLEALFLYDRFLERDRTVDKQENLSITQKIINRYQRKNFFYPSAQVGINEPLSLYFDALAMTDDEENVSETDIAVAFKVNRSTVHRWMEKMKYQYEDMFKNGDEEDFYINPRYLSQHCKKHFSLDIINELLKNCKNVVLATRRSKEVNKDRIYQWEQLFSSKKAASILGITMEQLAYYRKKRKISTFGPFKRYPRYIPEDVYRLKSRIKIRKK